MTTKMSWYDIRRREHGELIERSVLQELTNDGVIAPIKAWDNLIRPRSGQPFFKSVAGTSEQPLDEVGYVQNDERTAQLACIIEVKAMRASNWYEWRDDRIMHQDKLVQHAKHRHNMTTHSLGGVCIIAVNKDSSECLIRVFGVLDNTVPGWDYLT